MKSRITKKEEKHKKPLFVFLFGFYSVCALAASEKRNEKPPFPESQPSFQMESQPSAQVKSQPSFQMENQPALQMENRNPGRQTGSISTPSEVTEGEAPSRQWEEMEVPDWDKDMPASLEVGREDISPSGKMVFRMKTVSIERSSSSAILATELYGRLRWRILDKLSFYNQAVLIARNGFLQTRYEREDRKSGLRLIESYFDLEWPFFQIKVGNIKQDFLQAPLLVTDKTFPGLLEQTSFKVNENIKLSLLFQQAILNNSQESVKREGQFIRGFPFFLTGSFFLDWENLMKANIEDKMTLFFMHNLSPALAYQSNISGNHVDRSSSKADAKFRFKFFGLYNTLKIYRKLSEKWIVSLGWDYINNFKADDKYNQGERYYSSLYYNYLDFMEFKLTGEYFANQSDTSVAYFNSEIYGHNNRVGGLLSLTAHLYKSGITLGLSYVRSAAINKAKSAQGAADTWALVLMSNYMPVF